MKRSLSHFDELENLVSFSYSNFGNSLQVYEKEFKKGSNNPLGYCYRYRGDGITIYNVVHTPIGRSHTDRRIVAHEYGHITLGHLSGIHEELDGRVMWTIQNNRAALINGINKNLGIDYADKLLARIIDDPRLNHSLHNIAMDFEVNQTILSDEDIKEMEEDITEVVSGDTIKKVENELANLDLDSLEGEEKEAAIAKKKKLDKFLASITIKLMLPSRYHLPDGSPFPDNLTYPEYLLLIVQNLSEFVKMLISIKCGGNGDTSKVTEDQIRESLDGNSNEEKESNGDQSDGDSDSRMQSIDDLLDACGLGENPEDKYKGTRDSSEINSESDPKDEQGKDHGSESRDEADKKRSNNTLKASSVGCGNSGGPTDLLDVTPAKLDPVSEAIDEVIQKYSKKVCGFELKKDMTYLYNRGINREVIAPVYHVKVKLTTEPKIVYLIDVSGSMNRDLVHRVLSTISAKMKLIKKGLKYDIITWSTRLGEHIKDIDPRKPVPNIRVGGGTCMAQGIRYFKENYNKDSILVLISDFEDYLEEWENQTMTMSGYDLYGFNYGYSKITKKIKNFNVRNFNE